MCSVVVCDSWRRKTHRFKLPEDPERRLEWVQFLLEVNGQRLKESSWTDITICNEHFTRDCFEQLSSSGTVQLKTSAVPSLRVKSEPDEPEPASLCVKSEPDEHKPCQITPTGLDQLMSSAVPSPCIKSEPDEPEPCQVHSVQQDINSVPSPCVRTETETHMESLQNVEPLEDVTNCPTSSENSRHTLTVSEPESCPPAVPSGSDQMQQKKNTNIDLNKETAAPLQMKGKHLVNESCLFQLFRRKCPSCGSKLKMEKITSGVLLILNQQCLQCEYRNQWKSQVNASLPSAEDQQVTQVEGGTPATTQETSDDTPSSTILSETVTFSDEESDASDEGEAGNNNGAVSSDGEWNPTEDLMLEEELNNLSEEEPEEDEDSDSPSDDGKIKELCTECGGFFDIAKPHTCVYKKKPFCCNVCGKRCVTEISLKLHSRIHEETYDYLCKYCHVPFKTRVDKLKHEQVHLDNKDPYNCPSCPETFSTHKIRSIHMQENHATIKECKCGVCGIVFITWNTLKRHMAVHTGEKPFKCSVCQRGFNQASHLKSHMRLHTGERPFQCQHCDKSFNHNVSLKSHVQRYHSSSSGREGKKEKLDKKASDTGDERGTDSELDNIEEVQDSEEENKLRKNVKSRRSTGRPKGRPKRNAADGKCPKTAKSKVQDRGADDEQLDSDLSFSSAQEEEEEVKKSVQRSRRRLQTDRDTDFDPETKKKRYSSQRSRVSSRKGKGRAKQKE